MKDSLTPALSAQCSDHNEIKLNINDTYLCDGREQDSPTNIFHSEHNEIKITPNYTYPCDGREQSLSKNIIPQ